jgi:hypothetical protein
MRFGRRLCRPAGSPDGCCDDEAIRRRFDVAMDLGTTSGRGKFRRTESRSGRSRRTRVESRAGRLRSAPAAPSSGKRSISRRFGAPRRGLGSGQQRGRPGVAPRRRRRRPPVVLPAVFQPVTVGRGDRAIRPVLVQPRRGRAGSGFLHPGRAPGVPAAGPGLEKALVDSGIHLVKLWFSVSRAGTPQGPIRRQLLAKVLEHPIELLQTSPTGASEPRSTPAWASGCTRTSPPRSTSVTPNRQGQRHHDQVHAPRYSWRCRLRPGMTCEGNGVSAQPPRRRPARPAGRLWAGLPSRLGHGRRRRRRRCRCAGSRAPIVRRRAC